MATWLEIIPAINFSILTRMLLNVGIHHYTGASISGPVVEYRTHNFQVMVKILPPRLFASNLEEVDWSNLLCTQANSASYPQRDGKWVVAHGLWGEGLVRWLGRWYVCGLHCGYNCPLSRAMDDSIMRHGIISSRQSAATTEIEKQWRSWVYSCTLGYSKHSDLYLITFTLIIKKASWVTCGSTPLYLDLLIFSHSTISSSFDDASTGTGPDHTS